MSLPNEHESAHPIAPGELTSPAVDGSRPVGNNVSPRLEIQAITHNIGFSGSEVLCGEKRGGENLGEEKRSGESLSAEKRGGDKQTGEKRSGGRGGERRRARRRREAAGGWIQSLLFMCTVAMMLLAARFVVPSIVEEIRFAWHRGELRAEYEASGQGLSDVSLEQLTSAYQMVSQRVAPSVVHIEVIASGLAEDDLSVAASNSSNRRSPLRDPSVAPPMDASKQTTASDAMAAPTGALMGPDQYTIFPSDKGSGVIVDADDHQGFVLTNLHVLSSGGAARVILSDGRKVAATVVGVDAMTDLALLQINASGLIPIAWGDSDACRVGSPVWAIGSPFGLDRTVTFGIISGKHRIVRASARYQDLMQSDVAVNPGNSGGPLVNAKGQLVGINTAIVGDTYRGVSFSIPSRVAQTVVDRLRERGHVNRGFLGVGLAEVDDTLHHGNNARLRGAMITHFSGPNSPGLRSGLNPGDVIREINGEPIIDVSHLMRVIGDMRPGQSAKLQVRRGTQLRDLKVEIGQRPSRRS